MFKKLKKLILKWLGLDSDYYIGVDFGYYDESCLIIIKQKRSGKIEVIADHKIKSRSYKELLEEINYIAKKHSIPKSRIKGIVLDK